ncbi:MAG: alpha-ketoacid dehydrogenase subunit beta [Candidatus Thorarchaeota archaeon]
MSDRVMQLNEAINEAIAQEMERDSSVVVFGEDVESFGGGGGVFGVTKGLKEKFGERVKDTPMVEAAIVGAALGSAITGLRPIAEIMFVDFIGCAMDQILNQLAKTRYMFGGSIKVPAVIRCPSGSRWPVSCGAAQHSQSLEAFFMHIPGLKVVAPSMPFDAKGLMISAIRDDNPVIFIEHKLTYYAKRSLTLRDSYKTLLQHVPPEDFTIPIGAAEIKREGNDVTIVATMMMVHKALKAAEELSKEGIEAEIVDPRTLVPLDTETIIQSIKKTSKAVVVTEETKTASTAAEIGMVIMEQGFDFLDAPVIRVCAPDAPIPHSTVLEGAIIPQESDIVRVVRSIV